MESLFRSLIERFFFTGEDNPAGASARKYSVARGYGGCDKDDFSIQKFVDLCRRTI